MKHKKRTRYQSEDLKVWCEAEVTKDDIVPQWKECTCKECCRRAVYGTNKKGYYIDEVSRYKAEEQLNKLKEEN